MIFCFVSLFFVIFSTNQLCNVFFFSFLFCLSFFVFESIGTCGIKGVCQCYEGWGVGLSHDSGDCSDRICPYEIAWVDRPNQNGEHHKYAECAGAGICDRTTGDCNCFPGFEGKGCRRTSCPNGCSGHGTCQYIEDMGYDSTPTDYYSSSTAVAAADSNAGSFLPQSEKTFSYYGWDKHKSTGCVCDPGFTDYDCSKLACPYATDVMAVRPDLSVAAKNQKQTIFFVNDLGAQASTMDGQSFALTFQSKLNETFTTRPLTIDTSHFNDFVLNVQFEMMFLPTNVVDTVKVTGTLITSTNSAGVLPASPVYYQADGMTLIPSSSLSSSACTIATPGTCNTWPPYYAGAVQDPASTLSGAGLFPQTGYNNYGLLTDSGIQVVADTCSCPAGSTLPCTYSATTSNTCVDTICQDTVYCPYGVAVTTVSSFGFYLTFEFTGNNVQGPQDLMVVKSYECMDGCNPLITGLSLRPKSMVVMETQKSDLNSYECGRRGKCDYTTGTCTCFSGYTGASCNIITALV